MGATVLVTGGNSGIGYATAEHFKNKGYDVIISGRDKNRLAEAAERLNVTAYVCDMGSVEDINELASQFCDRPLDVLVNNAGSLKVSPLESLNSADIEELINTNVVGPVLLTQRLLPSLRSVKGCVVNVSSIMSNCGVPNCSIYAATKGAIDAFTRSLSLELAPDGVRVNAVSPGSIDTPLSSKSGIPESVVSSIREQIKATIPLQRHGMAEEVAEVIYAQASSSYVTGAVWSVDGGVGAA